MSQRTAKLLNKYANHLGHQTSRAVKRDWKALLHPKARARARRLMLRAIR